jgi:LacI family transcriptional regulator
LKVANILDVAKRAGVAPITVSRVINNTGYIKAETRAVVEAAIHELGYVPNTLARGLRSSRTQTLALVITDLTNPFFTIIARVVGDTAAEAGFNVFFCNTDESEEKEEKYVRLLLQKQVDGILIVPAKNTSKAVDLITEQGKPVVILDRQITAQADIVRCDSENGAYQLVKLLTSLGHRRITMINGAPEVSISDERLAGYQLAMTEAGAQEHIVCYPGAFNQEMGYKLTQKAMTQTPRPTALFAANNLIAIGALKALQDMQIKVPEEVAVVGFDDLPANLVVNPFLTVAAQPVHAMSRKATELLLARINGSAPQDQYQNIKLPVEIIVRSSSGGALQR